MRKNTEKTPKKQHIARTQHNKTTHKKHPQNFCEKFCKKIKLFFKKGLHF